MYTKASIAVVLAFVLTLTGCSSTVVTDLLLAAVNAAIAADAATQPENAPYLMVATACANAAAVELATSDLPAVKAAKIGSACAAAVAAGANAPAGVAAVVAALSSFLQAVAAVSGARAPAAVTSNAQNMPGVDQKKLAAIRAKIQPLAAKYLPATQ